MMKHSQALSSTRRWMRSLPQDLVMLLAEMDACFFRLVWHGWRALLCDLDRSCVFLTPGPCFQGSWAIWKASQSLVQGAGVWTRKGSYFLQPPVTKKTLCEFRTLIENNFKERTQRFWQSILIRRMDKSKAAEIKKKKTKCIQVIRFQKPGSFDKDISRK